MPCTPNTTLTVSHGATYLSGITITLPANTVSFSIQTVLVGGTPVTWSTTAGTGGSLLFSGQQATFDRDSANATLAVPTIVIPADAGIYLNYTTLGA